MKNHLKSILDALLSGRVVFPFLLLLVILFIDECMHAHAIFSELDILEHFLFGFIISEATGRVATSTGVEEWMVNRINKGNVRQIDLLIRFLGFLIIGGLLWESLEYFLFPAFGVPSNPFFALPITLKNIDGTIDVITGILGCILSWHTTNFVSTKS